MLFQESGKNRASNAVCGTGVLLPCGVWALISGATASLHEVAAETGAGWVAMHMQGAPATMQDAPHYDDVVAEVTEHLAERVRVGRAAGIDEIWVDPGIGFGKTAEQSIAVLARLDRLTSFGLPLLVGASRKRFIDWVSPAEPQARLGGSIAAHLIAAENGAAIIRTHDVAPTIQALRVAQAIRSRR